MKVNPKMLFKAVKAGCHAKAPQIAIVCGILAGGAALVTACIQTTKLSDIVEKGKEEVDERQKAVDEGLNRKKEDGSGEEEPYTQEMADADKKKVKVRTALAIVKLYAGPAALSALAIAFIFGGCHMFSARLAESVAAYNGVVAAYKAAQDRCAEVVGKEKACDIFNDIKRTGETVTAEVVNDEGKVEKIKTENGELVSGPNNRWSFEFSKATTNMRSDDHMYNQRLFNDVEKDLNKMLDIYGAVTVNEALRKLGICGTSRGMKDGWIRRDLGGKDGYVQMTATCVDYRTQTYILEFNIDGDISLAYADALKGAIHKRKNGILAA